MESYEYFEMVEDNGFIQEYADGHTSIYDVADCIIDVNGLPEGITEEDVVSWAETEVELFNLACEEMERASLLLNSLYEELDPVTDEEER